MLGLALRINVSPYHRGIVISDTKTDADYVVFVRITTRERWRDQACILTPADWSELKHDSTVAYSTASVERSKAKLEAAIQAGQLSIIPSPSIDVLRRICRIGREYEFTPPIAKLHIAKI